MSTGWQKVRQKRSFVRPFGRNEFCEICMRYVAGDLNLFRPGKRFPQNNQQQTNNPNSWRTRSIRAERFIDNLISSLALSLAWRPSLVQSISISRRNTHVDMRWFWLNADGFTEYSRQ